MRDGSRSITVPVGLDIALIQAPDVFCCRPEIEQCRHASN
jgi:hypothetical protein